MTNPNCRVLIFSILRFISTKCCKTQNLNYTTIGGEVPIDIFDLSKVTVTLVFISRRESGRLTIGNIITNSRNAFITKLTRSFWNAYLRENLAPLVSSFSA